MSSGSRSLEDLRREAAAAALGLQGGELTLIAALEAFQAENERVAETYHAMVRSLALALEARDGYTGEHSDAVERLAVAVATGSGSSAPQIADVQSAALLHDIGKIDVPDRVLRKPGRLDRGRVGADARASRDRRAHPAPAARLRLRRHRRAPRARDAGTAAAIPTASRARTIPLASRIVLVCDAWHALVSDRPYRAALAGRRGARGARALRRLPVRPAAWWRRCSTASTRRRRSTRRSRRAALPGTAPAPVTSSSTSAASCAC